MFIDYTTLVLINLVAGLVLMAAWIFLDAGTAAERRWVPGLLMAGLLALVTGLHMVFSWPLPGSFNILFGEMSVFFGMLLLGLVFVLMFGLDVLPVAIYGMFAGAASIVVGIQVLKLGLTDNPPLAGAGFLWMGILGLGAVPLLRLRGLQAFRVFGSVGLLIAAVLWGAVGYTAYWHNTRTNLKWKPLTQQVQQDLQKTK